MVLGSGLAGNVMKKFPKLGSCRTFFFYNFMDTWAQYHKKKNFFNVNSTRTQNSGESNEQ